MKHLIEINEVIGTLEQTQGPCEACATANAWYDEEAKRLTVELTSSVRTTNLLSPEQQLTPAWLPTQETIHESAPIDEAIDLTKDIFQRWVRKVRESIPSKEAGE